MKKMKRYAGQDERMVEGDASVAEQMEKSPAKSAPKSRVVTKEELEASGLSLRDFLNKERGLTRRGESAPAKTEAMPAKPPASPKEPKPMQVQESSAPPGYYRDFSGKMQRKTATERPDLGAMIGSGVSKVGKALASAYQKPEKYMTKEEKESKMRAGSSTYKTGGSVSSASKRADGIAQRGKTRGKMC